MKSRFTGFIIGAITVIAMIVFAYTWVRATVYSDPSEVTSASSMSADASPEGSSEAAIAAPSTSKSKSASSAAKPAPIIPSYYPVRLIIPSIGIDAAVQAVGLSAKGNMAVPTNFTDAAWYRYGAVPGTPGNAVIDGHVDNGLALPGVFKHLSDIAVGSEIEVISKSGQKTRFAVTSLDTYDYQNVPAEAIFTDQGPAWLILITCEGSWVPGDKTYDKRLIVTADLQN